MNRLIAELPAFQVGGKKYVGRVVFGLLVLAAVTVGAATGLFLVYSTDLPQVSELERYRPSAITELYDDHGRVIGSFALQRRVIASYEDFPRILRDAVISTEDKEFESHWGVDFSRVFGALWHDVRSRSRAQGASTLTMQLSRNLFLSSERSFHRKIQELMLAIQIERRFTKPQIFTMYANQIYLGHGVYGFEAGAQYYFGKKAKDLTLEEAAVLAALPKGPGDYSPITRPERALKRRNLVINSMMEDGKITAEEAARAKNMPLKLNLQPAEASIAPYFAEEVRRYLERKYGSDQVHQGGLRVYTSLNLEMQEAANKALLDGLAAYERRHGWKGKLRNVVKEGQTLAEYEHPDWIQAIAPGSYVHALVLDAGPASAAVKFGRYTAAIGKEEIAWTGKRAPNEALAAGDIAYVKVLSLAPDGTAKVALEQDSGTQGGLVALDNATGDIKAMVGGRDFDESKFNRATQALRQVGSAFKPFVYTAAIEAGATPDDVILDAPTVFSTASGPYAPHNYDNRFEGNITLRRALAQSRNIPALKLAEKVGINTVIEYAKRFGITSKIPPYLPVALGSAEVTLIEQTSAFTTFPNDGVRVAPRYIRRVTDYEGHVLEENYPEVRDVIGAETARTMTSMLREVVLRGTGAAANSLKTPLGGKTGTTNDFTDAWFIGFSPSITCGIWMGFDEKKNLGKQETGGHAALPMWIEFMKVALRGHEGEDFLPPAPSPQRQNVVAQKVDTPDENPGDGEAH
ncbi:MAG TPA: PBP1A family penicillin-binding protein [Terriglobales bacterium]|nr:PBP1A family penicillin-binding protein [Terriglobales bacterium]